MIFLSCCASPVLRAAPERLASWTTTLRAQQPDDAFTAVYDAGPHQLIFIGAQHSNATDSRTFHLITDAYALFNIDTVITEGSPRSRGPNSERLITYASQPPKDGFQEAGELAPSVVGALQEGATIWGGEPDDLDIKSRVLAQGFPLEDLLGFYTLRSVPQWVREQKIENAGDPRLRALVEEELTQNRTRLALEPTVLPAYADWASWYQTRNGKPIGPAFANEEVGPLADGPFGSNKIAAAISRARAAYLHELVISHLNAGETVLVVFGGSHLMIHRPALDAVVGPPCYAGADLRAALNCRG
ncbi:hypothetical protein ACFQRC_07365 [Enterovirga sp. GCM10030262]|uniref:hypothetical protein n=1 Tax=Enterovirga sp. GCM10030262 TaxID=3273391 RepID=UPI003607C6DC